VDYLVSFLIIGLRDLHILDVALPIVLVKMQDFEIYLCRAWESNYEDWKGLKVLPAAFYFPMAF
jgi:hypothetical protein